MRDGNGQECETTAGRRAHSRLRLRLPTHLITLSGTHKAILTDLSVWGAKVINAGSPQVGEQAVLQWGPYEAFGTVVWSGAGACGLRFFEIVPPMVVVATRDLNDAERLGSERDIVREVAGEWVNGVRRL